MNNTIFKNYTIVDNVLIEPNDLINRSLSINYYTNEETPFGNFNLSVQVRFQEAAPNYFICLIPPLVFKVISNLNSASNPCSLAYCST